MSKEDLAMVVSMLPFTLYCIVILWHGVQVRKSVRTKDGRSLVQAIDDLRNEIKRSNDMKERT
jgi:hypothetical protein